MCSRVLSRTRIDGTDEIVVRANPLHLLYEMRALAHAHVENVMPNAFRAGLKWHFTGIGLFCRRTHKLAAHSPSRITNERDGSKILCNVLAGVGRESIDRCDSNCNELKHVRQRMEHGQLRTFRVCHVIAAKCHQLPHSQSYRTRAVVPSSCSLTAFNFVYFIIITA